MGTVREKKLSLAGKRKMSPPKKAIWTDTLKKTISGNTMLTLGTIQVPPELVIIPESPQKISGSFYSSSSLSLNSWDCFIDEYFEDVPNNNAPACQKRVTYHYNDLSVRGGLMTTNSEIEEFRGPTWSLRRGLCPDPDEMYVLRCFTGSPDTSIT